METHKRVVGGMMALRDSKLSLFGLPAVLDKIKTVQKTTGMNIMTLWPHHQRDVNLEVIKFSRDLGIEVHLWYPVLADNDIIPDPHELTENAWGKHGRGINGAWPSHFDDSDDTYAFACPRVQTKYNRLCLARFEKLLEDYDGAIIENIRYPTPANGIESVFSCFCPVCREREPQSEEWVRLILEMRRTFESATDADLDKWGTMEGMFVAFGIDGLLRSREDMVHELASRYARVAKNAGKSFALALLTPALRLLAGHDYERLTPLADWIRPLVLCRARCPSGLRVEITSMLRGMNAWGNGLSIGAIMRFFTRSIGVELRENFYGIEEAGLPADAAVEEFAKAKQLSACPVYPSFEFMRDNPDYQMDVEIDDIRTYLKAAEQMPGFFMAWNLLYYPMDFMKLVR